MSGTRSSFPKAPATEAGAAVVVAHGSPSCPGVADRLIRALARRVGRLAPQHLVRGATLARPGALEAALHGLSDPLIYPLFMADGWFVRTALPNRLADAGQAGCRILRPFGLDPAVWALCRDSALKAAHAAGWAPRETTLLLAAHGSPSCPRPRAAAERAALSIQRGQEFRRVIIGYIDEDPRLSDVAVLASPVICVPYFATRGGHVRLDIPDALLGAGFVGKLLPPVGSDPNAAAIIASALRRVRSSKEPELSITG